MPWSSPVTPGTQPPLSPAEMDLLVARTGLTLNPGQMGDLVLAWRQLAGLIASIPRSGVLADDQAYVFRLPGPPAPPTPPAKPVAKREPNAKPKSLKKKTSAKPARKR